jgi:hypothetical protein
MKNRLLTQLSQDDFQQLAPFLKSTAFTQHTILFEAEEETKHGRRGVTGRDARVRGHGRGRDGWFGRSCWSFSGA